MLAPLHDLRYRLFGGGAYATLADRFISGLKLGGTENPLNVILFEPSSP
jgi:hypothetical protein